MAGDLVGGNYPLHYNPTKLLGAFNATQADLAARSNLEWPIGSLQDAAAALVTGDLTLVAVPVEYGDTITAIDVWVGATAAGTPTHSWAALFSGTATTATRVGVQSADTTTAAIGAGAKHTYTLPSPYLVNTLDSPNGFIYVGIGQTATTVSSLISGTVITAAQKAFYPNMPTLAATISAAGGTAPASITLASTSAVAAVPVVVLR